MFYVLIYLARGVSSGNLLKIRSGLYIYKMQRTLHVVPLLNPFGDISQNAQTKTFAILTDSIACGKVVTSRQAGRQNLQCDQVSVSAVFNIQPECMIKGSFIETEAY